MARDKATAGPAKKTRASKPPMGAAPQSGPRKGNPVLQVEGDEKPKRHNVVLSPESSLRLLQAVNDEKIKRAVRKVRGRVTESTILDALILKHLPPLRD